MKKRYKGNLFLDSLFTLFIIDCDGVLTDGTIPRRFSIYDGLGLKMIMQKGVKVIIVSGATSDDIRKRANELNLTACYLGVENKENIVRSLIQSNGLNVNNVLYMGDDLNDLLAFKEVGLSIAPKNAIKEIKNNVNYITKKQGGAGAVREVCDLWLKYYGKNKSKNFSKKNI